MERNFHLNLRPYMPVGTPELAIVNDNGSLAEFTVEKLSDTHIFELNHGPRPAFSQGDRPSPISATPSTSCDDDLLKNANTKLPQGLFKV